MFEKLYVFKGTIFIVTSNVSAIPKPKAITSSGYMILSEREDIVKRLPTEKDIRIVTPAQAQELFSTTSAVRLQGATFLCTDANQFIDHYYHFSAELLFGFWRTYTSLDPFISENGQTNLPSPRRLMFRHVKEEEWRDYANMNQWVLRGAFPGIGLEFAEDWNDRAEMGVPFVFDRVVLGDRAAAEPSEPFQASWRYASPAFDLPGSIHWWQPLRKSVLEFSGLSTNWISGKHSMVGAGTEKFVITYISRQDWGRRMLLPQHHEKLVDELYKLRDKFGYEVNVVSMQQLSRAEQIQLAGRTTIMMGVHGNGLTSLIWMRPKPESTVMEFFYPKGFAFDYEWTTRALGMKHYGFWGTRYVPFCSRVLNQLVINLCARSQGHSHNPKSHVDKTTRKASKEMRSP